jgi:hypothetical protein
MKRIAKYLIPLLTCSSMAMAADDGLSVKLSGTFDFSAASYNDNSRTTTRMISANKKGFGFYSTASVSVNVENRLDNDLAYGARVALETATRNSRKSPSVMWFESKAGKLELGSDKSAVSKMKVTATSNAFAAGGAWDTYVTPYIRDDKTLVYLSSSSNFLDAKTRNTDKTEYTRKVTYFTPKWNGLQAGVSYIPDTTNTGTGKVRADADSAVGNMNPTYNFNLKDGFAWGVSYENSFNDVDFKASVVGERAKVSPSPKVPGVVFAGAKFKNVDTYTVGALAKYRDFTLSGAYGDYKKSLSSAQMDDADRRSMKWYDAGLSYRHDSGLGLSVTHFASNARKNKLTATTVGVDYKNIKGLLPYAEFTSYKTHGKHVDNGQVEKIKGTFFVLGTKLEF